MRLVHRGDKPEEIDAVFSELSQTNIVGNIHLFNLFLPLVRKGKDKKFIAITSGLADLDLTNKFELDNGSLYAASKAALNIIIAKFSAQYKDEGILFVSVSPGVVDVGRNDNGMCYRPRSKKWRFLADLKLQLPQSRSSQCRNLGPRSCNMHPISGDPLPQKNLSDI